MTKPTMRQLRSWHRRLTSAHKRACAVGDEAESILSEDGEGLTLIIDPIVYLHAALCCIEGLIEERGGAI